MKNLRYYFLMIFACLMLTACNPEEGMLQATLITQGDHVISSDHAGDLILLGGTTILPEGVSLNGSAHIFSGKLNVNGTIQGDIAFLNGDLTLGPDAVIHGDLSLGSESFKQAPGAKIMGATLTGSGISIPNLPEQKKTTPWGGTLRSLISAIILGFIAMPLARFLPRSLNRVSDAAIQHPLISGAMGILVGIVGISLLITMAYTILLIPVTLLGFMALGASVLYSWICLGSVIGEFCFKKYKQPFSPSKRAFFGTCLFVILHQLVSNIPVIGGLIGLSLTGIGLGAVFLTRFGIRNFVPAVE
jgi:hypothetical protein